MSKNGLESQDEVMLSNIDKMHCRINEIEDELADLEKQDSSTVPFPVPQISDVPTPRMIAPPASPAIPKTVRVPATPTVQSGSRSQTASRSIVIKPITGAKGKRTKATASLGDVVPDSQELGEGHCTKRRRQANSDTTHNMDEDVRHLSISCVACSSRRTSVKHFFELHSSRDLETHKSFCPSTYISCNRLFPLLALLILVAISKVVSGAYASEIFTTYSLNANGLCHSLKMNHVNHSILKIKPSVFVLNESKTNARLSDNLPVSEYEVLEESAVKCESGHLYSSWNSQGHTDYPEGTNK